MRVLDCCVYYAYYVCVFQLLHTIPFITLFLLPLLLVMSRFFFSFQDSGYLYLCTELAPGGELTHLINTRAMENLARGMEDTACDYETTRFYMGEIIEALEYLHTHKIIHRDLKPESEFLRARDHCACYSRSFPSC